MLEIKVLTKALEIIEAIVEHRERSCKDLSRDLHIPLSTTHRILQNLEEKGYLFRNSQGLYRLGSRFLFLKAGIIEEYDLAEIAMPIIKKMVSETRESSNLGILDGKRVIHICRVESPEALRANIPTMSLSPHTSATGKLLLAFKDLDDLLAIFQIDLPSETPRSITDRKKFLEQLRQIRQQHYAVDNQEGFEDVVAIAVPVTNQNNEVVAALSLAGPASRFSQKTDEEYAAILFQYADMISRRLGCGKYPFGKA